MERLCFLLVVLLAPVLAGAQDVPRTPVFDVYSHDFGTISEADGPVSYTFHLLNNSGEPVSISQAIPGCSCISAEFSTDPVLPGKVGDVIVTYNPAGAVGETHRTIVMVNGEGASLGTLSTVADVTPADRSIQERYFYSIADLLYANRTDIQFGYVFPGVSIEKPVYIANASGRVMQLRTEHTTGSGLSVGCPAVLRPEQEAVLSLAFSAQTDDLYKTFHDTVWIYVDGKRARLPIVTTAVCLNPVPSTASDPDMQTYPSEGKLSKNWFSAGFSGFVTVANKGKGDLVIFAAEAPEDVRLNITAGTVVRPGASIRVKAESDSNESFLVNLYVNDPLRPRKQLIFKHPQ